MVNNRISSFCIKRGSHTLSHTIHHLWIWAKTHGTHRRAETDVINYISVCRQMEMCTFVFIFSHFLCAEIRQLSLVGHIAFVKWSLYHMDSYPKHNGHAARDVSGISMWKLRFAFAEPANELNYNFYSATVRQAWPASNQCDTYSFHSMCTSSDGIINS